MNKHIFIAGHNGMVGSSLKKFLEKENIVTTVEKSELDLTDQKSVNNFFKNNQFDEVYIAAAKVGGIHANDSFPAEFIYQNLMIQTNIINSSYLHKVNKLMFLGSSCIYPKYSEQPIKEEYLLRGLLERTNEPYAIAKIAGIKMCESYNRQYGTDFRSIMPANLYGPGDNYHPLNSHVIPGLIRRIHDAKNHSQTSVSIWGSGSVFRDFLFVDDLAHAAIFLMNIPKETLAGVVSDQCSHINAGSNSEISIENLANMICKVVGYKGGLVFDKSKPDGTKRKLISSKKLNQLGWNHKIELMDGLEMTYKDFLQKEL